VKTPGTSGRSRAAQGGTTLKTVGIYVIRGARLAFETAITPATELLSEP
jgi:hypothetical protein